MCQETQAYPMTNTHLLLHEFTYLEPATLDEAISLLNRYGDRAQILAGGTYLLVQLKQEHKAPEALVNISKLPALHQTELGDEYLSVGALSTIHDLSALPAVQAEYQALAEACAAFGSKQIQMMGTVGGNVCNGSPASDTVPALLAFDAQLVLLGPEGERELPLADFLLGPGQTAIQPGEVLTQIKLPRANPGTGSAFVKITRVQADLAKVSAAAVIVRDGDTVIDCKLAFGSVAPTVVRCPQAEAFLKGKKFSSEVALAAGELAMQEVSPIDDVRSSAWYRCQVVKTVTHDVLTAAWERAKADAKAPVAAPKPVQIAPSEFDELSLAPDERVLIKLHVNGTDHELWVGPNDLLLNVLREQLELTGSKYGCGIGECGACTVLINGKAALGCLTLAVSAHDKEIVTVEGLQNPDGSLHPLQEAFLDQQAFQCGYCTPGILMMTKALLDTIPDPDEDQIREYLRGNRCRCTGFASITRAVLSCVE